MESWEKEFSSDLRYAYRNGAINMFGKHYTELNQLEIKTILNKIIDQYFPLRPYKGSIQIDKDEFLQIFKRAFRKELKRGFQ